jgi:eukaryotic-like serine/threonine-protein kinase
LRADDRALVDAAASVADGAPVDWVNAETRADADNRRLVRHLRLVESIARLHRSIPPIDADDSHIESATVADRSRAPGPAVGQWGRLSLLDRIGHGTSCEVYRAWDTALQREVALKLLHDDGDHVEAHARVLQEARRLARIRHPHVVQVYGAEHHDNRVGLWMELVRGQSLEEILQARGPFGAREAALIGLDLSAALAAVHGAGLLHRDIKAQNVMRESGGRLVLMDFGTGEELSGTNRLIGTPLYLAPEIFRGQRASVQSDLYSLGVLLFYLVTGKFPVIAGSMEELAQAHAHRRRQSLRDLRPDLPEAFVGTVERALDNDPTRRYHSVGDFESALRDSLGVGHSPAAASEPVRTPPRRFGLTFASVVAALVLAIVALIVWTRTTGSNRGTVVSSIRTIAVMPMSDSSASTLPAHFAAGLTDELIATLGQISALSVKSGLSVSALKNLPPREIAETLGVDGWLETTLTPGTGGTGSPDGVRVRVNLIEAGAQTVVWTRAFDRPRGETLALQIEIARAIAEAVRATVTPAEAARLSGAQRQTDPAAEEAYLLGRSHLDQYGAGSAGQALKAFERALQLDPQHAAAHAAAARAYVGLGVNGAIPDSQARAQALAEVRRALELDGGLAEAHATLAHIHFRYDWDWSGADREFRRSLDLNPSSIYARTFYAEYLAALGRLDEAVAQSEIAKRLDPQSGAAARRYALVLYYKHDFPGAERAIQEALQIEPSNAGGPLIEGRIAEARGDFTQALEATERAAQLSGGGLAPLRIAIIRLQALSGQRPEAIVNLRKLQNEGASRALKVTARDLAYVQLAFGNDKEALDLFAQALDERDPSFVWLGVDPRVDALRTDPRFRAMLRSIGLPTAP